MTPHCGASAGTDGAPAVRARTGRWRRRAAAPLALVIALLAGAATSAGHGFALHDLTRLDLDADSVLGPGFTVRAEPARMTLACFDCQGELVIDLLLGRQDDGTEQRVRAGITTMPMLEAQCRARNPTCRLEGVSVAPAVGWLTSYALGPRRASTLVVLRDGDLLTVRALGGDAALVRRQMDALRAVVVPRIVGP